MKVYYTIMYRMQRHQAFFPLEGCGKMLLHEATAMWQKITEQRQKSQAVRSANYKLEMVTEDPFKSAPERVVVSEL